MTHDVSSKSHLYRAEISFHIIIYSVVEKVRDSANNDNSIPFQFNVPPTSLCQSRLVDADNETSLSTLTNEDIDWYIHKGLKILEKGQKQMNRSEIENKRHNYLCEMKSWLDAGNRSWIDDQRRIDVERGGSAGDIIMGAVKGLGAKIAALPKEGAVVEASVSMMEIA